MRFTKVLIGQPIWILSANKVMAHIKDLLIDPKEKEVIGLIVEGEACRKDKNIISLMDITHIATDGIIIESEGKISNKVDFPKGYGLLNKGGIILNSKAKSSKGTTLGKVINFAVDDDNKITRLYLKKKFSLQSLLNQSFIDCSSIEKIKKGTIILKK